MTYKITITERGEIYIGCPKKSQPFKNIKACEQCTRKCYQYKSYLKDLAMAKKERVKAEKEQVKIDRRIKRENKKKNKLNKSVDII